MNEDIKFQLEQARKAIAETRCYVEQINRLNAETKRYLAFSEVMLSAALASVVTLLLVHWAR